MDLLPSEELENLKVTDVLRESITIPRASPRTFALITLSLVFPLSFAILAHSLFTHPIFLHLEANYEPNSIIKATSRVNFEYFLLFLYQFLYLLFLFTFSLLSTGAVVFTVASLYSSKPVTYSDTMSAIRLIFPRLFGTFLWVSIIMVSYNILLILTILLLLLVFEPYSAAFILLLVPILLLFLAVHVYISALWHLASVVTVLEPICGLEAMAKSRQLLKGRCCMAVALVTGYLGTCGIINGIFRATVVKAPYEEGSIWVGPFGKILIGGALVAVLVIVNLVGLLAQSVFYYACKSFHHQQIDKSALYDHLGGFLGEYVPLKSSIQMENL
ncbi:hypothetical protein LUZ63_006901 [Rhynchospora breviuscula]|uniref:Uncharacterized protein n=1 Tax=Rhynchospora breviuscula TaxID=2022672 RepID=A0A9Q0CRU0_9POAL|nr:hypothetical protein LUZ63_006901 [Rhynchospora breviuscula]